MSKTSGFVIVILYMRFCRSNAIIIFSEKLILTIGWCMLIFMYNFKDNFMCIINARYGIYCSYVVALHVIQLANNKSLVQY